jgi:hypothetical protein
MAEAPTDNQRTGVFRTRAVLVAGVLDFTFGIAILIVGLVLIVERENRDALPLGLAISVVGVIILLTGLGRMTSRLEVTDTSVSWTWGFSRHDVAFRELEDADLVEKGAPASGASWAGFLGGGFLAVLALWLVELVTAVMSSEPTLGPLDLVVIKHHGDPVEIKPISAWSTRSSHTQANLALQAVKTGIASSSSRSPQRLPILQHDEWDTSKEH